MSILDKITTADELAKEWNVTPQNVRIWCEEGRLEAKRLGREWAILKGQPQPTKIRPKIKLKGVKKAVGEFNNWQGPARIYLDRDNLSVWTVVYTDGNSWTEHDGDVVEIYNKLHMSDNCNKTTMREVQEAAEQYILK